MNSDDGNANAQNLILISNEENERDWDETEDFWPWKTNLLQQCKQ